MSAASLAPAGGAPFPGEGVAPRPEGSPARRSWDGTALERAGLNLQAVFDLDGLPGEVAAALRDHFDPERRYRQLILVGHAGRALWAAVKASGIASANPIDDFSVRTVEQWLAVQAAGTCHTLIYPGDGPVGLQTLGRFAGWHHDSPLAIGIDAEWGSWYAYRVALLADSDFAPSRMRSGESPCPRCRERSCVAACPAGALAGGRLGLEACVAYRRQPASMCRDTCLARLACPIGAQHRYCDEQIRHTYSISLRTIEALY